MRASDEDEADLAGRLARGVMRGLAERGFESLAEFPLANGRRADVMALDRAGRFLIVEIKTSLADFRGDAKWRDYLDYCDLFGFAVPEGFPLAVLPDRHGLYVADAFDFYEARPPAATPGLAPARRKSLTVDFARAAARRCAALLDPRVG